MNFIEDCKRYITGAENGLSLSYKDPEQIVQEIGKLEFKDKSKADELLTKMVKTVKNLKDKFKSAPDRKGYRTWLITVASALNGCQLRTREWISDDVFKLSDKNA